MNAAPTGLVYDPLGTDADPYTTGDQSTVDLATTEDDKDTKTVNESVIPIQVRNAANDADIDFAVDEHTKTTATNLGTLDVLDQNALADSFGKHDITVSDSRFEIRTGEGQDASQGQLWLKAGKEFDYEKDGDKKGTLVLTITATDGGGAKVVGKVSIQIADGDDPADPPAPPPTTPAPSTPGLKDDTDDSDDDGPVPVPPPSTEAPASYIDGIHLDIGDDLLDDFVVAMVEDFDIA